MNNLGKYIVIVLFTTALLGCKNVLDVGPRGTLNESQILNPEQAEGLVIAAYAQLGNDEINRSFSMYQYGNVRSDDAYKGGGGISDGDVFHFMETFINSRPDQWNYDGIWFNIYIGVRRANDGLRVLNTFTEAEYPLLEQRKGELRFLRAYWYLMLENLFKNIPYIDETVPDTEYKNVLNRVFTRDQILDKIAEDFAFAATVLPSKQQQVGRVNKYAAYAFLAKTRLFQAYEQDEFNQVVNVNSARLEEVLEATNEVMKGGYSLEVDFANNFLPGVYENGVESIFAIQYSQDDGTPNGRLNWGDMLTTPQGIGCCDFQKPSQTLTNAFRTNTDGVPLLDNYNAQDINFSVHTVDPRLDHTISRPGAPWKYDTKYMVTESWSRLPLIYGTYNSMKENVSPDCDCFVNVPPFYGNTKTRIAMRYADVILFKAEALIELNREQEALPLINSLRIRAAKSKSRLTLANGQPTSNYLIQEYKPGQNIIWSNDNARKALRFERRLELALEGQHFFDLLRWGTVAQDMNSFFEKEKGNRVIYQTAKFTSKRDEYLPIPQNQIFWSEGKYKQNPGY